MQKRKLNLFLLLTLFLFSCSLGNQKIEKFFSNLKAIYEEKNINSLHALYLPQAKFSYTYKNLNRAGETLNVSQQKAEDKIFFKNLKNINYSLEIQQFKKNGNTFQVELICKTVAHFSLRQVIKEKSSWKVDLLIDKRKELKIVSLAKTLLKQDFYTENINNKK